MTECITAQTSIAGVEEAAAALADQVNAGLKGKAPDAVILFASPAFDYTRLLTVLQERCHPGVLLGCSSAGEFTENGSASASACAMALRSTDLHFKGALARNLRADRGGAAAQIAGAFDGIHNTDYSFRYALVLADALAGYTEDFLENLTLQTGGQYKFFGGGAGDDARFSHTHVFFGTETYSDSAVALEILSNKPLGIGVSHGWKPATPTLRVTESDSACLSSLNAIPAAEVYADHALETGENFDTANPMPFFLHHVLGINTGEGYKLRVPLAVNANQSIACAADVPEGSAVSIMRIGVDDSATAAARATRSAVDQLQGNEPAAALFFDCAATRLRLGHAFAEELDQVAGVLGAVPFAGCNTYGQIARAEGQFSGFHNCTAVVCVFPN